MDTSDLKLIAVIIGGYKIMRFLKKAVKTAKIIKKALPELKKELLDLTGKTRETIDLIVDIWD
jgi:uncharacterized membrane-anchored protein YhcB (DUF1043 family)